MQRLEGGGKPVVQGETEAGVAGGGEDERRLEE